MCLMAALAVTGCKKRDATLQGTKIPTKLAQAMTATEPAQEMTTAEMRVNAVVGAREGEARLGSTVASLGDPSLAGFWIRTPLVGQPGKGRVVNAQSGASVQVDLLPMPGEGGSQLSLATMRLLGVSLTELPEIIVFSS